MVYVCEDPNDALQRRMHEDMDTCAFTHFGMLEKTGAIEARADEAPFERATLAPPRAAVLAPVPALSIEPAHVAALIAILAALAWYVYARRKR